MGVLAGVQRSTARRRGFLALLFAFCAIKGMAFGLGGLEIRGEYYFSLDSQTYPTIVADVFPAPRTASASPIASSLSEHNLYGVSVGLPIELHKNVSLTPSVLYLLGSSANVSAIVVTDVSFEFQRNFEKMSFGLSLGAALFTSLFTSPRSLVFAMQRPMPISVSSGLYASFAMGSRWEFLAKIRSFFSPFVIFGRPWFGGGALLGTSIGFRFR